MHPLVWVMGAIVVAWVWTTYVLNTRVDATSRQISALDPQGDVFDAKAFSAAAPKKTPTKATPHITGLEGTAMAVAADVVRGAALRHVQSAVEARLARPEEAAAKDAGKAAEAADAAASKATTLERHATSTAAAAAEETDPAAKLAKQKAADVASKGAKQARAAADAVGKAADDAAKAAAKAKGAVGKAAKLEAAKAAKKAAKAAAQRAAKAEAKSAVKAALKQMAKSAEASVEAMAMKSFKVAGAKIAEKIGTKAAVKVATKLGEKVAGRAAETVALAFVPVVGWLMDIFDAATLATDLADPEGYNLFVSNTELAKKRDSIVATQYTALQSNQLAYPQLMQLNKVFPVEYSKASNEFFNGTIVTKASEKLMAPAFLDKVTNLMQSTPENSDPVFPADMDADIKRAFDQATSDDPVARDKAFLRLIQKRLRDPSLVAVYPEFSKPLSFGVSLSEKGVRWWNGTQRMGWLRDNDWSITMPPPSQQTPVVLYTSEYRRPGTGVTTTERLTKGPAPLAFPFAPLYSACEKVKKTGDALLDPYAHGVRYDTTTGLCRFTPDYCANRLGLTFRESAPTECVDPAGEQAGEMIQSTTIVRAGARAAAKKTTITFAAGALKRRSTTLVGKCATGAYCTKDADCSGGAKCKAPGKGKATVCTVPKNASS